MPERLRAWTASPFCPSRASCCTHHPPPRCSRPDLGGPRVCLLLGGPLPESRPLRAALPGATPSGSEDSRTSSRSDSHSPLRSSLSAGHVCLTRATCQALLCETTPSARRRPVTRLLSLNQTQLASLCPVGDEWGSRWPSDHAEGASAPGSRLPGCTWPFGQVQASMSLAGPVPHHSWHTRGKSSPGAPHVVR